MSNLIHVLILKGNQLLKGFCAQRVDPMTLIATIGENETLGCQSVHWLKQKKSETKIQNQNPAPK